LANESIGMNCRTVFRFRATKAATASVSVSVAWPLFLRPAIWQTLEIVPHKYGRLKTRAILQHTLTRLALISQPGGILWYLSSSCQLYFFFVQDTAPSHLAPGKYTFFDLLPFLSSLFHIFDSLMYCVDVVRYMAICCMLAPRIYGLHPDKIIHFDLI